MYMQTSISSIQPTFLLPPGIVTYPGASQPWFPVLPQLQQQLKSCESLSASAIHGVHSQQFKPSSISTQPLRILNEAEQAAIHSTPVELMQTIDTSENQLNTELFTTEVAISKGQATYPELFFLEKEYDKEVLLEVIPKKTHHMSSCGNISVARILFNPVEPSGFT